MVAVRKRLEKACFSLLLLGVICLGVVRVVEGPREKVLERREVVGELLREATSVTKPLDLLRRGRSDHVLLFNRVPKSGSEMLVLLLQWLQGANGFRHVRLRGGEKRRLSVLEQEDLVEQVTAIEKTDAVPVSFDRHVYFVNFTRFDRQWPIYLNLVRDPVEKAVSRFYYGRVTPNPNNPDVRLALAQGLAERKRHVSTASFEDCVLSGDPECNFITGNTYDLTIPYFCGHDPRCSVLNNGWALQRAKSNVEAYFPVVGVLEELNSTLVVLERKLDIFFRGVQNVYFNELLQPHKNKNKWKPKPIRAKVRSQLKNQLKDEYEFYYWVKARLLQQHEELQKRGDVGRVRPWEQIFKTVAKGMLQVRSVKLKSCKCVVQLLLELDVIMEDVLTCNPAVCAASYAVVVWVEGEPSNSNQIPTAERAECSDRREQSQEVKMA